ncbi:lipopolysaccharide biosynthesis protein [Paraurantiacibacter namhicola]|uniref:Inner membrane protein YghQ n=1 Tax=Paraurantiacibacter namhicola TaxID=645517 RepID=A0A1C7D9Y6_9SPHN|nr:lipopolysaccharide biosynthesis protein [Paraurantiacibacter namhicola]ANU08123.1 Inner membrane protein YghQ [Paraurantiacibacter namhicola]
MDGAQSAKEGPGAGKRILRNVGMLLGGKGFGAVSSLAYLAILSRSLGVKDFGHFSLIFGITLTVNALCSFATWQMIIRFGTEHLAAGRDRAFGRLSILGGLVDAFGALIGSVLAVIGFFLLADALEVNPAYRDMALLFVVAMQWARVSAPYGILRALDRFDLSVYVGAVTPAGRLLAAVAIWLTDPSVGRFLFAWAAVEFLSAAVTWYTAWRLRPDVLRLSALKEWRQSLAENPGLRRFLGVTYMSSSVHALIAQGPLLAVGYLFGTSAAGVYRIAEQLAMGLGKLAIILSDSIYPELNKERHGSPARQFQRLVRQVSLSVLVVSVAAVALAVWLGEDILVLISGEAFIAGGAIMVPLVLAASFELASVSYESVLHSTGKARYQLYVRIIGLMVLAAAVWAVRDVSSLAVGWMVTLAQGAIYALMTLAVWAVLRRLVKAERAA